MAPDTFRIINCIELPEPHNFLENSLPEIPQLWTHVRAIPQNFLEQKISRPNIARYRASASAAIKARAEKADIIVSHLPRMTASVAVFADLARFTGRHLAFSFNFTDLPGARQTKLMRKAFRTVDRFVVFSTAEITKYSDAFDLDPKRIDRLHWAMQRPVTGGDTPVITGDYLCSVGGEGRDYDTLFSAARQLPLINFVVVTRPHALDGITSIPDNVRILLNQPNDVFWNIVEHAKSVILPLKTASTMCGHISLVGAMHLAKPIVATYSSGTEDYLQNLKNCLLSPPKDVEGLVSNIELISEDPALSKALAQKGFEFAEEKCSELEWQNYWRNYLLSPNQGTTK